jgi:hypothetical protein
MEYKEKEAESTSTVVFSARHLQFPRLQDNESMSMDMDHVISVSISRNLANAVLTRSR